MQKPVILTLDSRNRLCLTKILGDCKAKTFKMFWRDGSIVLAPLLDVPSSEIKHHKMLTKSIKDKRKSTPATNEFLDKLERKTRLNAAYEQVAQGKAREITMKELEEMEEKLEDESDIREARLALKEIKKKGAISLKDMKKLLDCEDEK